MSALIERIMAARERLANLDRPPLGYGIDIKTARDAMADAANAIQERDETIFYMRQHVGKKDALIAALVAHGRAILAKAEDK